ncbi:MAG: hypothetical protein GYB67_11010 [Chloroflexi bacterium]|nr:hypothetical protein [Chloroflexota bacterium]
MAYLNAEERRELLEELAELPFRRARGKLNRIDPRGRIAYFRNAQESGRLMSRWVLEGKGTRVTLVEADVNAGENVQRRKPRYELVEVIVEPLPENRT